jgi:hypothetical protein
MLQDHAASVGGAGRMSYKHPGSYFYAGRDASCNAALLMWVELFPGSDVSEPKVPIFRNLPFSPSLPNALQSPAPLLKQFSVCEAV